MTSTATPGGIPEVSFGRWLRMAREQSREGAGMSQAEVALAVGVSRPKVGNWEQGRTDPDIGEMRRLVALYEASWLWEAAASSIGWCSQLEIDTHIPLSALTLVR